MTPNYQYEYTYSNDNVLPQTKPLNGETRPEGRTEFFPLPLWSLFLWGFKRLTRKRRYRKMQGSGGIKV